VKENSKDPIPSPSKEAKQRGGKVEKELFETTTELHNWQLVPSGKPRQQQSP